MLPCAGCQSSPDVRDWASPVAPLTRVGTAVRCVSSPFSRLRCLPHHFHPSHRGRSLLLRPTRPGWVPVFSRIRYATVRWHHSRLVPPPKGIRPSQNGRSLFPALLCASELRPPAPRRVSHPARMAAVSFRHFFVRQSFAPFIYRTESLDLLPLRRSALPHMHHPHPAGGRPGSSSRIRTI